MEVEMDIQKLMDAFSDAARMERSNYHVTLGRLLAAVEDNPDGKVIVDGTGGLGREDSYRGYYADLSFVPAGEPTPCADVRTMCERALTETYEGYKGGDFTYDDRTALWVAHYGCTGPAIVDLTVQDGNVLLTTKIVD